MAFLHRNKRKIDLGGASKRVQDKQKLIEQTAKEREKRSEDRALNAKALRIQSVYRCKKAVKQQKIKEKQEWLGNYFSTLSSFLDQSVLDQPQESLFTNSIRQFLYFYSPDTDEVYLALYCKLISKYFDHFSSTFLYSKEFKHLLENLLIVLISKTPSISTDAIQEDLSLDRTVVLNLVLKLTSPSADAIRTEQLAKIWAGVIKRFPNFNTKRLTLYQTLHSKVNQRFTTPPDSKSIHTLNQIIEISLRPIQIFNKNPHYQFTLGKDIQMQFILQILAIKNIIKLISTEAKLFFIEELFVLSPDMTMLSVVKEKEIGFIVFENVLSLFFDITKLQSQHVVRHYLQIFYYSFFYHSCEVFKLKNAEARSNKMETDYDSDSSSEDEEDGGNSRGWGSYISANSKDSSSNTENKGQWDEIFTQIFTGQNIKLIFNLFTPQLSSHNNQINDLLQSVSGNVNRSNNHSISTSNSSNCSPLFEKVDKGLVYFCNILSLVLDYYGCTIAKVTTVNVCNTIINTLAYNKIYLPYLLVSLLHVTEFRHICANNTTNLESNNSSSINNINNFSGPEADIVIPFIMILTKCYNHLLYSLDDDEFVNNNIPLAFILPLSTLFKQLVFKLFYFPIPNANNNPFTLVKLRTLLSQCLTTLYDKNSRRNFTFAHHWSVDEISSIQEQKFIEMVMVNKDARFTSILNHIPFLFPLKLRVLLLNNRIAGDQMTIPSRTWQEDPAYCDITRGRIVETAYQQMRGFSSEEWKGAIKIKFYDRQNLPEAGIDGGGVFREFLNEICKIVFRNRGEEGAVNERETGGNWFVQGVENTVFPNSEKVGRRDGEMYEFFGKILGKAVYEGVLVDVPFANFFLSKILRKTNYYNDLIFLDKSFYDNVLKLKNDTSGNLESWDVNFSVTNERGQEIELVPGGRKVLVNESNRLQYIYLMANYKLNYLISFQSKQFLKGFSEVIPVEWIQMFNQEELSLIIAGNSKGAGVDLIDLRENTRYLGEYHDKHGTIRMFWQVMETLEPEELGRFLKFVTSVSRPPLLGFKYLTPQFTISPTGDYDDVKRLPTASTCMNLLKLPGYSNAEQMTEKLKYAINTSEGFQLS